MWKWMRELMFGPKMQDETKDSLRKGRSKKPDAATDPEAAALNASKPLKLAKSTKKRVSFG